MPAVIVRLDCACEVVQDIRMDELFAGSFRSEVQQTGAIRRHQLVPPIHAVEVSSTSAGLCGAEVREVFTQWPWDDSDFIIGRCELCSELVDDRLPEVEEGPSPFFE